MEIRSVYLCQHCLLKKNKNDLYKGINAKCEHSVCINCLVLDNRF